MKGSHIGCTHVHHCDREYSKIQTLYFPAFGMNRLEKIEINSTRVKKYLINLNNYLINNIYNLRGCK